LIKKHLIEPEMSGKTLELCLKILTQLMEDIKAPPFNAPVDPDKLGIPEYRVIIRTPMDLGTIKSNLSKSRNRYKNLRDFAAKVRLVFDNARTFNQSGSAIYNDAEYLSKLFETKYAELQKVFGLPKSYDPPKEFTLPSIMQVPPLPLDSPVNKRGARDGGLDNKRKRKSQTSTNKTSQRPTKTRKPVDQTSSQTVTLAEKKAVHEMLVSLSDNEWAMVD